MIDTRCLEDNYAELFSEFHHYIIDEYDFLLASGDFENKYSIPTTQDITKGAYEELYQYVAELLVTKINNENNHQFKYEVVNELYSNLFDQFILNEPIESHPFFHRICRDVEKLFSLYQIFYRVDEELIHQPVTEVW